MFPKIVRSLLPILIFGIIPAGSISAEYIQAPAAIGVKTTASEGRHSIADAARLAKDGGFDVLIVTDALINRWQYGVWPFRNIIRQTRETWSISRYGLKRYIEELGAAGKANPGLVILGGVEVAPFYYWEGFPLLGRFAIRDWHKHMIVAGLDTVKGLKGLPIIGNISGSSKPSALFLLVPLSIFVLGLFCLYQGRHAVAGVYERSLGVLVQHWRVAGILITMIGALLLVDGYPYRQHRFDAYHGSRGSMPYQNLIDHVDKMGGLTFWTHPEAGNIDRSGKVGIMTGTYGELLLETSGYTGFAIFPEGYEVIGRPGGVWDSILREYCEGLRRSPAWAVGTLDYERSGSLAEYMTVLRTVLLVRKLDRDGVLDALRRGRSYVSKDSRSSDFILERFTASDISEVSAATMGETIEIDGAVRISLRGSFKSSTVSTVRAVLLRDGEPVKNFQVETPFDIKFDDETLAREGRHYYRLELKSEGLFLVTNPVFVTRRR